jgi:hypothetical protein
MIWLRLDSGVHLIFYKSIVGSFCADGKGMLMAVCTIQL